jgi:hypothetical protein
MQDISIKADMKFKVTVAHLRKKIDQNQTRFSILFSHPLKKINTLHTQFIEQ